MIRHRAVGASHVELTFILPSDHPGEPVGVAGEFNDWQWESTPFQDLGGSLVATVLVAAEARYRFRYRSRRHSWFNDEHADDYVANDYGGVDCVFDSTLERRALSPVKVIASPNHLAMLQRVAEVCGRHPAQPVTEDQIFDGMAYSLGSRQAVLPPGTGPGPLSHLLVDLADADLLAAVTVCDDHDPRPRWALTPTGRRQLRSTQ